ncbi:Transcriptional regulatory protein sin3 [Apophysomyces sp. BC1021]|nr:Transcriptional regulatory protein sin3 [Apophysomyces sp. BC1021]
MSADGNMVRATSASPSSQSQSVNPSYRRLNVEDAVTYLEQVRAEFSDQPGVYNRFLDIMKEFKRQSIDTPGVIERVSTLFRGHPTLISGFKTFLPPGYHIECSADIIRVTTPSGTTTTTRGGMPTLEKPVMPATSTVQRYYRPSNGKFSPFPSSTTSRSTRTILSSGGNHPSYFSKAAPMRLPVTSQPPAPSQQASGARRPPIEFNHAINYVNKIKNRFSEDPDIYKEFLEVLQNYQKDLKSIHEVYAHVQYLFKDASDLFNEFKQFLPELSGSSSSNVYEDANQSLLGSTHDSHMLPYQRKKGVFLQAKRQKVMKEGEKTGFVYPKIPSPDVVQPAVSGDQVELFERIRKHIGNKPSYEEFLKTLNLFSHQIIDMGMLIEQVEVFLGNNAELFDWFKNVVEYEPAQHKIERPQVISKPDLMNCKTVESSPSYRTVSKDWQNQSCSGRDQLCWEVLNDEYVSHPIWASEDSGFVASKKNQSEETLHRCEEERYDYDLNIEANLNVIALLEPIAKQLEAMSDEEKAKFRLKPGLGGETVSIYQRIINKIYGADRGAEIIEMLYNNAAYAVPVVLSRLKQKHEEWRKTQREWNTIWRDLDSRNYYRALDYQGMTFKSNDRKGMSNKALVAEIEALRERQHAPSGKSIMPPKPTYQFLFTFSDPEIFKDISTLILLYVEKQTGFTSSDKAKIREFIANFIPLFFRVNNVIPERHIHDSYDEQDKDAMDEDEVLSSTSSDPSDADIMCSPDNCSLSPTAKEPNGKDNPVDQDDNNLDIQYNSPDQNNANDTAMKEASSMSCEPSATVGYAPTKNDVIRENKEVDSISLDIPEASDSPHMNRGNEAVYNLFAAAAAAMAPGLHQRTAYSFFCTMNFYCLFRLYQMVYERLLKMKMLSDDIKENPSKGKVFNKVAIDLGLYSDRFDDIDLSQGYYQALLDLIERFFDGDLDQAMFEDSARYIFVNNVHIMFTIDKLIHALIKQVQVVASDPKSTELVRLFRSDQALESMSPRTISTYRNRTEKAMGKDEQLYKVAFNIEDHTMRIQLLCEEDPANQPTAQDHYEYYVTNYMNWARATEDVDISLMKRSFLHRIGQGTYHMYYIIGTEDVFIRPRTREKVQVQNGIRPQWALPDWSAGVEEQDKQTMEAEARRLLCGSED